MALRVRFTFLTDFSVTQTSFGPLMKLLLLCFVGKKKGDVVEEDYDDDNPCARCFSNVRPDSVSSCSVFTP